MSFKFLVKDRNSKLKTQNSQLLFIMAEHAHKETRQRISDCRKRLRRTRAGHRALRVAQDEAVPATDGLLALVSADTDFADSEEIFEEAGTSLSHSSRRFAPEVDRPQRLRAR
jgi:hypothetical protein